MRGYWLDHVRTLAQLLDRAALLGKTGRVLDVLALLREGEELHRRLDAWEERIELLRKIASEEMGRGGQS
jgi:hypothetical protein